RGAGGGVGPVASSLMTIVAGDGSGEGISEDIAPSARRVKAGRPAREGRRRSRRAASAWRMRPVDRAIAATTQAGSGLSRPLPRAETTAPGASVWYWPCFLQPTGRLLLGSGGGPPRN